MHAGEGVVFSQTPDGWEGKDSKINLLQLAPLKGRGFMNKVKSKKTIFLVTPFPKIHTSQMPVKWEGIEPPWCSFCRKSPSLVPPCHRSYQAPHFFTTWHIIFYHFILLSLHLWRAFDALQCTTGDAERGNCYMFLFMFDFVSIADFRREEHCTELCCVHKEQYTLGVQKPCCVWICNYSL